MITRFARALALSLVLWLGWSGATAAQTPAPGNYNFSFTAAGFSASGSITVGAGGSVTSISNFLINGLSYVLNTSGPYGGADYGNAPELRSETPGMIFYGPSDTSKYLLVTTSPGSNNGYLFGSSGVDFAESFAGGTYQRDIYADSSSLTAEPVPVPLAGAGLLSWLLAALGTAGYKGGGRWRGLCRAVLALAIRGRATWTRLRGRPAGLPALVRSR